jgi:hypothetical protein
LGAIGNNQKFSLHNIPESLPAVSAHGWKSRRRGCALRSISRAALRQFSTR